MNSVSDATTRPPLVQASELSDIWTAERGEAGRKPILPIDLADA